MDTQLVMQVINKQKGKEEKIKENNAGWKNMGWREV